MKKLRSITLFPGLFFLTILTSHAQTIVTIPVYPTDLDSTTVIYDATKGNAALMNVSPPVYAHTGVITNLSTSGSDWRYVIADWSVNLPKALMTPLGNNLYQIKLQPSIRGFYGVPSSETIEKIAFVFRNSDGSKVGREANGGDIFGDVYSTVLSINISLPESHDLYLKQNTPIPVMATSPLADSLFIYVNNTLYKSVAGVSITDTIPADNFGSDWVKNQVRIMAKNDTAAISDSFSYAVIPDPTQAPLPSGTVDGINYINDSTVVLSLFAPHKTRCFVLGDFNNWQVGQDGYMNQTPDSSRYWIQLDHLIPQKEYIYQYLVDGTLAIGDPYADKVSDPEDQYISSSTYPDILPYPAGKASGVATVFQTGQIPYTWDTTVVFTPPKITDLVIYELLIRDFTSQHTYQSVIDTLNYLKRLGVNAIELMPVMEFEGNSSWGYNPDFLFAPDKYYGPKNSLKALVDAAHAKGLAVILDIVLNHQFGESPLVKLYWDNVNNRPAANSPWFNPIPKHPYNVGYDFNHESPFTTAYCERVVKYWLSEYRIDGYRFDLSKGFTQVNSYPNNVTLWGQYDSSRITIIKHYYSAIRSVKPDAFLILEHFADNSEETELASNGMLLWGNMNYNYNEATMGWNSNSDFSWISYLQRGWSQPHLVGYMESHDEERLAFKNITYGNSAPPYNTKDTNTSLNRLEMAATFFYTIPGPKMLWQFGELGYDYSINYPSGTSDSRLSPKPIRWDYYKEWRRRYLFNVCASLIDLRKNHPAFESNDFTLNVSGPVKGITIRSSEMDVAIIGNFDVKTGTIIPGFSQAGTWYDFFSGDSVTVINMNDPLTLQPGEYHLFTSKKLAKPFFTGIDDPGISTIDKDRLSTVYPNPSADQFTIIFSVNTPVNVTLIIYDIFGKQTATLENGLMDPGMHRVLWNTGNFQGQKVSPGIYFYRLTVGNSCEVRKLIVQ